MGYYKGKIKVVCPVSLMCFPAHPKTLEPMACGCYDAYAIDDPDKEPVDTLMISEWNRKLFEKRDKLSRLRNKEYDAYLMQD